MVSWSFEIRKWLAPGSGGVQPPAARILRCDLTAAVTTLKRPVRWPHAAPCTQACAAGSIISISARRTLASHEDGKQCGDGVQEIGWQ